MRIQKGKIRFSRKEVWNIGHVLQEIIVIGLKQFKESKRLGIPMEVYSEFEEYDGTYESTDNIDMSVAIDKWEEILDHIIKYLCISGEPEYNGSWIKRKDGDVSVFGIEPDGEEWDKYIEELKDWQANHEKACEYLGKYISCIWD